MRKVVRGYLVQVAVAPNVHTVTPPYRSKAPTCNVLRFSLLVMVVPPHDPRTSNCEDKVGGREHRCGMHPVATHFLAGVPAESPGKSPTTTHRANHDHQYNRFHLCDTKRDGAIGVGCMDMATKPTTPSFNPKTTWQVQVGKPTLRWMSMKDDGCRRSHASLNPNAVSNHAD
jgi:hypothetical protein